MTNIVESLIADGLRWLPGAALIVVTVMVLRTWVKSRSAVATLVAIFVAVLVVGFVSDTGGFATLVVDELKSRAGS